jgi:hypothetical protein
MRHCATVRAVAAVDPDLGLRQVAVSRARELAQRYDDLVPLAQLQAGFVFDDQRVSFGSFQRASTAPASSEARPRSH